MNGDPLPVIVSGMYAFGATGFDASGALTRMVAGSTDGRERPGYAQYDAYGYVPVGTGGVWGSAATTLEYASADFVSRVRSLRAASSRFTVARTS